MACNEVEKEVQPGRGGTSKSITMWSQIKAVNRLQRLINDIHSYVLFELL